MNELRYQNHLSLESFDQETQERIAQSTITIFGIGGLGSVCSLYLTNAGVGKMNLVDYDTVDETNLPRQVIYKPSQVGMNKALAAKATLADFNPEVNIRAYDERMMGDDLQNIIKNSIDEQLKLNFRKLHPVLKISYDRKYLSSVSDDIRITLDTNVSYFRVNSSTYLGREIPLHSDEEILVEIKYDQDAEQIATGILDRFHSIMSRNSKYTRGMVRRT